MIDDIAFDCGVYTGGCKGVIRGKIMCSEWEKMQGKCRWDFYTEVRRRRLGETKKHMVLIPEGTRLVGEGGETEESIYHKMKNKVYFKTITSKKE